MTDSWEQFTGRLDYPMFVVTARAGDDRSGCLVGFATQASIDPARFLIGLSVKNRTYRVASEAGRLAVHLLSSEQLDLARLFGSVTGDDLDKFARCDWSDEPGGAPVLAAAQAWFAGRVVDVHPLGDHAGFLVEPDAASVGEAGFELLTFADVRDLDPGHEA